jgi:hypothetical protein
VKRRAKLSGDYLAEYERALAWAGLASETAVIGSKPTAGSISAQRSLAADAP